MVAAFSQRTHTALESWGTRHILLRQELKFVACWENSSHKVDGRHLCQGVSSKEFLVIYNKFLQMPKPPSPPPPHMQKKKKKKVTGEVFKIQASLDRGTLAKSVLKQSLFFFSRIDMILKYIRDDLFGVEVWGSCKLLQRIWSGLCHAA